MDWVVKTTHLLNSLLLKYFSVYAFYWQSLCSHVRVKDRLTRSQKTTATITVRHNLYKYGSCITVNNNFCKCLCFWESRASVPLYSNYTFFYELFIHYKAVRYLWISCRIIFILIFVTIPSKIRSQQINIANCHMSLEKKLKN